MLDKTEFRLRRRRTRHPGKFRQQQQPTHVAWSFAREGACDASKNDAYTTDPIFPGVRPARSLAWSVSSMTAWARNTAPDRISVVLFLPSSFPVVALAAGAELRRVVLVTSVSRGFPERATRRPSRLRSRRARIRSCRRTTSHPS